MLKNFIAVALGGAVGASSRYAINLLIQSAQSAQQSLLMATLSANLIGCLLMGFMYRWSLQNLNVSESMRLFIMVGVLGALTTWSTFSMETIIMMEQGQISKALGYTLITVIGCFSAFWLGWRI